MKVELIHTKDKESHRKLQERMQTLCARIGWFDNTKYDDDSGKGKAPLVSTVARTQEFGTMDKGGHIPPRPFMRPTKNKNQNKWKSTFSQSFKDEKDMEGALKKVAEQAVGDIRKSIMSVWNPPLSQATVLHRLRRYKNNKKADKLIQKIKTNSKIEATPDNQGILKPLVDTGLLISSLSYEVINPSEVSDEYLTE